MRFFPTLETKSSPISAFLHPSWSPIPGRHLYFRKGLLHITCPPSHLDGRRKGVSGEGAGSRSGGLATWWEGPCGKLTSGPAQRPQRRQSVSQMASSPRIHLPDLLLHLSMTAWLPSLCSVLALPARLLTQTFSSACPRLHCSHTSPTGWTSVSVVFRGWQGGSWERLGACGPGLPPSGRTVLPVWGLGGGSDSRHLGLKFISNSLSV